MNEPLESHWPFLQIMHSAHLEYVKRLPFNTLDYFFKTLETVGFKKRHEIISYAAWLMFAPFMKEEELGELMSDPAQLYILFKKACRKYAQTLNEVLLIQAIIQSTLHILSQRADITKVDETKEKLIRVAEFAQSEDIPQEEEQERDDFIRMLVDTATNAPEQTEESYKLYVFFCENVIQRLLEQKFPHS